MTREDGHRYIAGQPVSASVHTHHAMFESNQAVSIGTHPQFTVFVDVEGARLHVGRWTLKAVADGSIHPYPRSDPNIALRVGVDSKS